MSNCPLSTTNSSLRPRPVMMVAGPKVSMVDRVAVAVTPEQIPAVPSPIMDKQGCREVRARTGLVGTLERTLDWSVVEFEVSSGLPKVAPSDVSKASATDIALCTDGSLNGAKKVSWKTVVQIGRA